MNAPSTPRRVLLTGGNRGLGYALLLGLLNGHHEVHLLGRQAPTLPATAGQLYFYPADVRDEASIAAALAEVGQRVAGLDLVVNNAAVHPDPERVPLEQADFSGYLEAYDINAVGPLRVLKYALPLLRQGVNPRVVNISSEAGSCELNWRSSEFGYCMSKAALNRATTILRTYLGEAGVEVFALHPGWFSSDMGGARAPITPDDAARQILPLLVGPLTEGTRTGYAGPDGAAMPW